MEKIEVSFFQQQAGRKVESLWGGFNNETRTCRLAARVKYT